MKHTLIIFLLVLAHQELFAGESFVCPQNNYEYQGVTCCLDSVSKQQCETLVDEHLPTRVLEDINEVQEIYAREGYDYGRVPNCFWGASNFLGLFNESEHRYLGIFEVIEALKSNHYSINLDENLLPGDLLVFLAVGERRWDIVENHVPKRVWRPHGESTHTAVILEEDIIFQKENIFSDVFSIDRLEHSLEAYEKSYYKKAFLRGVIEFEVWRKDGN